MTLIPRLARIKLFTAATARPARLSIGWMMCVIAIIAIDIAIGREFARGNEVFAVSIGVAPIGVGPTIVPWLWMLYLWGGRGLMVLILEAALLRALGTRGRTRSFWFAFLAAGLAVLLSCLPPLWRPPDFHLVQTAPTAYRAVEDVPGSLTFQLWSAYAAWVARWLGRSVFLPGVPILIDLPPMLFLALTSGVLARRFVGGKRSSIPTTDAQATRPDVQAAQPAAS
jgi:hypothetical protein